MVGFAPIWTALAIYSTVRLRQDSTRRRASWAAAASGTTL